jgi:threonine/homoserine/homoserine lactone efflux protein
MELLSFVLATFSLLAIPGPTNTLLVRPARVSVWHAPSISWWPSSPDI